MSEILEEDQLDVLLKNWAQQTAVPESQLLPLQERIALGMAPASGVSARIDRVAASPARSSGWEAVACCSILLLITAFSFTAPTRVLREQAENDLTPEAAQLSAGRLNTQAVLFRETELLFGSQLCWMTEFNESVTLGLENESLQQGTSEGAPLAVRLLLQRRTNRNTEWQSVWTQDLLTRSEQVIALPPTGDALLAGNLWVFALPDGCIAVDGVVQIRFTGMQLETSGLQKNGQPAVFRASDGTRAEYRMFQTVGRLPEATAI